MIKLKKILNEVSYEKSGLKNPKLADRDKDDQISSWEKKVGKNIEKNLDEEGDTYNIGMKKYTTSKPTLSQDMCAECGGMMYEDMCLECGWDTEESPSYDGGYEHEQESVDHEVSMAQNLLKDIISNASQLMNKIGEDEKDVPAWIQDHISQAQNFINQANTGYYDY
jgi:hypothetical protein